MFTLNVWVQRKYTDERKWGTFGGLMSIINNLHAGMLAGAKHEIATPASLFNISRTMFFCDLQAHSQIYFKQLD